MSLNLFSQNSFFLDSLIKSDLPQYSNIIENHGKYKFQVIYTQINRDKNNQPKFKEYNFRISKRYFYPASTVKLPMSLLALIKLEELKDKEISRTTAMGSDSAFFCQKKIKIDSVSGGCYPTIENYIKKMFLVSDNTAFTRTYEFVGHDYAHKKLSELGYKNVRLFSRLDGACPGDTAKITPPVYFLSNKNDTLYKQPITYFSNKLSHPIKSSLVGKGHTNNNGKKIKGPKDFSNHNYFHISDINSMMKKIIFNNYLNEKEKLPINNENRLFMIKQLGLMPKESDYPVYDKKTYYDSYKKYFMYASAVATINQDSLRVINIVGRAYGFLIDCAYIIDFKNKIEYFLTASVYVNERNVIGTGKYEYDQLGLPFLRDLSKCLYNFELKRKKEREPDLEEFEKLFKK